MPNTSAETKPATTIDTTAETKPTMITDATDETKPTMIIEDQPLSGQNKIVPKQKRKTQVRDVNKPKKAPCAFILWGRDNRVNVAKDLGNLTVPEMGRELGRHWLALDKATKLLYEQKAAAAIEQYKLALAPYTPPPGPQATGAAPGAFLGTAPAGKMSKKERRESRDPAAPKRALSSFMLWCQDERETVKADLIKAGDESPFIGTLGKELGLRWKNSVSSETKQKYEEKAAEAKASYAAQLASYTPSKEFLQKKEAAVALKKSLEQAEKKQKDPLAPKGPRSAYYLWSVANKDKVKEELGGNVVGPDLLRELSKRWGELDTEAKAAFEEQSRLEKQKYLAAMVENKLKNKSAP